MLPKDLEEVPVANGVFHHVGYATVSIAREVSTFRQFGYHEHGSPFTDPQQGIIGQFLAGGGPVIELIQDLPNAQTVKPWLSRGIKMYHIAYEVKDIEATLRSHVQSGNRIVTQPTPAIAFSGRLIAFVMQRSGLLIEFISET